MNLQVVAFPPFFASEFTPVSAVTRIITHVDDAMLQQC